MVCRPCLPRNGTIALTKHMTDFSVTCEIKDGDGAAPATRAQAVAATSEEFIRFADRFADRRTEVRYISRTGMVVIVREERP